MEGVLSSVKRKFQSLLNSTPSFCKGEEIVMWICPICFEKRQEGYRCRRCGFDKTEDFVRYRTISWVSEKDIANRKRYNPDSVGETGTHFYDNGDHYEGGWKHGKREGRGIYYWTNGDRYAGEFKNDLREGHGTYYCADGERYVGEWKDDKKNGHGIQYFLNGDIYGGAWKDDCIEGEGTLYWANGCRYEGQWKKIKKMDMVSFMMQTEVFVQADGKMTFRVQLPKNIWRRLKKSMIMENTQAP